MLRTTATVLVSLYALVLLAGWSLQRRFIYLPDPTRVAPADKGLSGVAERSLHTPDGVSLVVWYAAARPGRPTLLYFHGNGGNLANRTERIRRFMGEGLGVYMMSYRGYSGSGGQPSQRANVADAHLAYADLRSLGIAPDDIVIYGESLGTYVAARIAIDVPASGLVLDAPYTSVVAVADERFPFFPAGLLLTERYDTSGIIGKVRVPLLVVHGELDRIVPFEMGRQVFDAAVQAPSRQFLAVPGARHANHMSFGSFEPIVAFVKRVSQEAHERHGAQ